MSIEQPAHVNYLIVAALIEDGDKVLLVEQQGPNDDTPNWTLPGGTVNTGELVVDAVVREVAEETGLRIAGPFQILYISQFDRPHKNQQWTAFVFKVQRWSGTIEPADPDGHIISAQFVPRDEALSKLGGLRWRVMREPAMSMLGQDAPLGAIWVYRESEDGTEVLIDRPLD